jgi:peptidoglycan/LPS O-acetylase OafA/YrhL
MRKQIPILRGLAILGVVLHHCAHWGHHVMFYWAHKYRAVESPNFDQFGSPLYWSFVAMKQLPWFAVPAFLFIAGFSLAYALKGRPMTAAYRIVWTRTRMLLWPYLIWSFVIFFGDFLQGQTYSTLGYAKRLVLGGAVPAYWFIPMLIQFYILSPLIVRWSEARPRLVLLAAATVQGAMYFLCASALGRFFRPLDGASLAMYFPLGAVCFLHYKHASQVIARFKWSFLPAAVVLAVIMVFERSAQLKAVMLEGVAPQFGVLSQQVYALAFIVGFISLDNLRLPFARALRWLGTRSYGIYLLHFTVLIFVARVTAKFAPALLAHQILFQPLLLLTGIGLPVLFMTGVASSPFRKLYSYLFGAGAQAPVRRKSSRDHHKEVPVSGKPHLETPVSGLEGGS